MTIKIKFPKNPIRRSVMKKLEMTVYA